MKLLIVGAGAWGTALAIQASPRHQVTLWARHAAQVQAMQATRLNQRYLPQQRLPEELTLSHDPLSQLLPQADLVLLATPMSALRQLLKDIGSTLSEQPVAWLCKGFEAVDSNAGANASQPGLMAHEVQTQVAPGLHAGVLSGPSFAQEVAAGMPAALVAASPHAPVRQALVQAFHGDRKSTRLNSSHVSESRMPSSA